MTADEIDRAELERLDRITHMVAEVKRRHRIRQARTKTVAALFLVVIAAIWLVGGYVMILIGGIHL